ncbi:uncharacterized protein LOC125430094 isoform X1 [Sphaerodactylus townsendi]|uniref:uncharacterized protein LOC125430094 isoform X1 n=1 Tax=Sphaerodactylus townsendi TaxID=933632 RepID=UPI00202625B1|nr:uncharacterized protein LOC125430094 isoform X1 [Sphaerodactylus townsendi]
MIYRDYAYASHKRSSASLGKEVFPAFRTQSLAPSEERPLLTRKTFPRKERDNESPYEKNIERAASWRRKEHERIQQAEERRLMLSLEKNLCSRSRCCFTPNNSRQYQNLQSSEHFPDFNEWMKPYKELYLRPYTVMEETTINIAQDFPYRLAWGTPTTPNLGIKLYHPPTKFSKEGSSAITPTDKSLHPTKSIPTKGRFVLVCEPPSTSSVPSPTPMESKLLSARFPKLKDKIYQSLLSDMQESC